MVLGDFLDVTRHMARLVIEPELTLAIVEHGGPAQQLGVRQECMEGHPGVHGEFDAPLADRFVIDHHPRAGKRYFEVVLDEVVQVIAADVPTQVHGGLGLVLDVVAVPEQLGRLGVQLFFVPAIALQGHGCDADALLLLPGRAAVRQQVHSELSDFGAQ